jgi:AcrR family transcriptional regulator
MQRASARKLNDRRIERRETILAVTFRMISEKGYTDVTMDDLAEESGVTKRTLYDIYGSKDALLAVVVSRRMLEVLRRIEARAKGRGLKRLLSIVRMTIAAVLEYPILARSLEPVLLRDPGNFTIDEFFNRLHRQTLIEIMDDGDLVAWADIDFLVGSMMIEQIAVQNCWAADLIADRQLEALALLSVCRILIPVSTGNTQAKLYLEIRRLQRSVGKWPIRVRADVLAAEA